MEFAIESLETPALTKAQLAELLFEQCSSAWRRPLSLRCCGHYL